jgi:hypothetical protein
MEGAVISVELIAAAWVKKSPNADYLSRDDAGAD